MLLAALRKCKCALQCGLEFGDELRLRLWSLGRLRDAADEELGCARTVFVADRLTLGQKQVENEGQR